MGDVKKDVESMRRIRASSTDKLEIMADITDFIISSFVEKIKKENPDISREDLIEKLKVMLYHDRGYTS